MATCRYRGRMSADGAMTQARMDEAIRRHENYLRMLFGNTVYESTASWRPLEGAYPTRESDSFAARSTGSE